MHFMLFSEYPRKLLLIFTMSKSGPASSDIKILGEDVDKRTIASLFCFSFNSMTSFEID